MGTMSSRVARYDHSGTRNKIVVKREVLTLTQVNSYDECKKSSKRCALGVASTFFCKLKLGLRMRTQQE